MKFTSKDRFERVKNSCDNHHRINLEVIDTKSLYFHDHKPTNKKKFLTKEGFTMDGYNTKDVVHWKEIKNICKPGIDPYVDGLQSMAN